MSPRGEASRSERSKRVVGRKQATSRRKPPRARKKEAPEEFVLAPQVERPRHPLGQDRSRAKASIQELTWAHLDSAARELAQAIRKKLKPDAVVGVAHGGVFVGCAVAKALACEFYPVRISRRSRDRASAHGPPRIYGQMPAQLKGRRIVVVDDVAASGDTLELARELARKVGAKEVFTACLLARPGGFQPDWVVLTTNDLVVFPWDYNLLEQ